jgi:hypothetical protein
MADTTLTDPLGRDIVLHDRTWYNHIVRGHPEMTNQRGRVEATVGSPDEIRQSTSDSDCRLYYGPGPRPAVKMMVVVDIALRVVKTAHLAKKVTGGAVEWSR